MSHPQAQSEEEILRATTIRLSRLPGVWVGRNEANALTHLYGRLLSRLQRYPSALEVVKEEYQRIHPSKRYGLGVGSSDLIVCARGRFVGLEMKAERGQQSEEQRTWQGWVERAGGIYLVTRSPEMALDIVQWAGDRP